MFALLILFGIGALLFATAAYAKVGDPMDPDNFPAPSGFDSLYQKYAALYGLEDWKLLKAIALVESSENPNAVNPNDPSVGLMQVLCVGWPDACTNKLYLPEWPPSDPKQLLDPDYNVRIAAGILHDNITRYGLRKGIAVYNNFGARNEDEPFSNQQYLEKVLNKWSKL